MTFKPVTGLDVAKMLGQQAVEDYQKSEQLQMEQKKRMEKSLNETKNWFEKLK